VTASTRGPAAGFRHRCEHYRRKRERYGLAHPNFYDRDLRRLFSDAPEFAVHPPATVF
jgi:hypothetical protein